MIFSKTDLEVIRKLIYLKIKENLRNSQDKSHFVHYPDGYYFRSSISNAYLLKLISKLDKKSYLSAAELFENYLDSSLERYEQIKF